MMVNGCVTLRLITSDYVQGFWGDGFAQLNFGANQVIPDLVEVIMLQPPS